MRQSPFLRHYPSSSFWKLISLQRQAPDKRNETSPDPVAFAGWDEMVVETRRSYLVLQMMISP